MKTILLFGLSLLLSFQSFSQVIWTGGGSSTNWTDANNWSSTAVPTVSDDVEIPAGFTVTISSNAACQSLELKGSAVLNIDGGGLNTGQPSLFEPNTTVYWAAGTIACSLLVNQGTMNLTSSTDKLLEQSTLVNNNGTINIIGSGDLFMRAGTVLNNEFDGTIDMQADGGDIDNLGGLPILNNEGLIVRSTSTGEAQIKELDLNNNGGIIQVNSGTLSISGFGDKNFVGGTYVVSAGTVLDWDTEIIVSGMLSGTIEGDLNWNNTVSVPVSATFNFTGAGNFNWTGGNLNGGGILTNQSTISLTNIFDKSIQGSTTLNNEGTINNTSSGNLNIQGGSVVNNQAIGVIDLQADNGNITNSGVLNNTGLLKRTTTTGIVSISVELNNSGTIRVETGELAIANGLPFTNEVSGVVTGVGIFTLPDLANYTNNGVFAPGSSPGTLTIQGDFESSSDAVLDVELDGLTQGTEYDLLAIDGDADFDGDVQITLGFTPSVNDEFIIATTTNTINTCNLPATAVSTYGGFDYQFDVICRNDNEVVLTVSDITVGIDSFDENESAIKLFPNPTSDYISFSDQTINSIQIYNAAGKLVKTIDSYSGSVADLETGFYLVNGTTKKGASVTIKLIKN